MYLFNLCIQHTRGRRKKPRQFTDKKFYFKKIKDATSRLVSIGSITVKNKRTVNNYIF